MKAEITREAFKALVSSDTPAHDTTQKEHAYIIEYRACGVRLFEIQNYLSVVTQYYIEDINA
jgi:hypothetical protein